MAVRENSPPLYLTFLSLTTSTVCSPESCQVGTEELLDKAVRVLASTKARMVSKRDELSLSPSPKKPKKKPDVSPRVYLETTRAPDPAAPLPQRKSHDEARESELLKLWRGAEGKSVSPLLILSSQILSNSPVVGPRSDNPAESVVTRAQLDRQLRLAGPAQLSVLNVNVNVNDQQQQQLLECSPYKLASAGRNVAVLQAAVTAER